MTGFIRSEVESFMSSSTRPKDTRPKDTKQCCKPIAAYSGHSEPRYFECCSSETGYSKPGHFGSEHKEPSTYPFLESLGPCSEYLYKRYPAVFTQLDALQVTLNYRFQNLELLCEALTHRSAVAEILAAGDFPADLQLPWYERLEFLGDAVIGLAISTRLMQADQRYQEGQLSKIRAASVNERALADAAVRLKLGDVIFVGRGEELSGARVRPSMLADVFEALIGAVYSESGFATASAILAAVLPVNQPTSSLRKDLQRCEKAQRTEPSRTEAHAQNQSKFDQSQDHKTLLQEWSQEYFQTLPVYQVTQTNGPAHAPLFVVSVTVGSKLYGIGEGTSKKRASQTAAAAALKNLAIFGPDKQD